MSYFDKRFLGAIALFSSLAGAAYAQSASTFIAPGVSLADIAVRGAARPGLIAAKSRVITPSSSVLRPEDLGRRAHTHYRIVVPAAAPTSAEPQAVQPNAGKPPYPGYYFETPASLGCIYGLTVYADGCNPETITTHPNGGSNAIALVDAYDAPNAKTDLAAFSKQFGLPAPTAATFKVVYAAGSQPAYNAGWAGESTLDIEMAHAMAPSALIYLVEAASNSNADLNVAVDKAYSLVRAAGGGEVSMSYGGSEYSGETSDDSHFNKAGNVVFFASTGDAPGVEYPSASPNVVAVGGTSTSREMIKSSTFGQFLEETAWSETGGGLSNYFSRPSFQSKISTRYGYNARAVPDVAADASDLTPVWVYFNGAWNLFNGTSVASPLMAGMTNRAATFRASSAAELTHMYAKLNTSSFFDVGRGVCGPRAGYFTSMAASASDDANAHDLCTGIGAPRSKSAF